MEARPGGWGDARRRATEWTPAIAARAGVECVVGRAVGLDPSARLVQLDGGEALPYDLVSFNVGSLLAGVATPQTPPARPAGRT